MSRAFRRICVFCGSTPGKDPVYRESARALGAYLAQEKITVVFGGGHVGLMGAVADGALEQGGQAIGVIPEKLKDLELAHRGLTELFVVDGMHARKAMMANLSDAFIALPGGWGTLEEVFEVTTWNQLNYHRKPVGLLNVAGYFDRLLEFIDHASEAGFIRPVHRGLMVARSTPAELVLGLREAEIPALEQWIVRP